jgi:hypothetical protein
MTSRIASNVVFVSVDILSSGFSDVVVSCLSATSICSDETGVDVETCSSCWVTGVNSTLSAVDCSVFWTTDVGS